MTAASLVGPSPTTTPVGGGSVGRGHLDRRSTAVPGVDVLSRSAPDVGRPPEDRNRTDSLGTERRSTGRRWGRGLLVGAAVTVLVVQLVLARESFGSAVAAIGSVSAGAMMPAALGVAGSVLCYSAVRAVTVRAAGGVVAGMQVVRLTVAAGAINATVPGGAVFSTAYAFRALRGWGLSRAAAGWSLTITGVLSTAALVVLALTAALLGNGSADVTSTVVEIGLLAGVLVALVAVTRDPRRLLPVAGAVLRVVNRVCRRPADHGMDGVHRTLDDLAGIRPTGRQFFAAVILSLATFGSEIVCLAVCLSAVGVDVSWSAILLSYAAGKAVTTVSPLPAGIGVVEGAMVVGVTAAGAPAAAALAGVLLHRLWTVGAPTVIGWIVLGLGRSRRVEVIGSTV